MIRLEEANSAVSTWAYDTKTGYPTEMKDAEAVANGWPGTTLTYQTGLNGFIADLIAKQSPEGRTWTFGYNTEGDLTSVTDPEGSATATAGDFTTTYTYDTWGQLLSSTDANGNLTGFSGHHASGYPQTITDAGIQQSTFVYDARGNVTQLANAKGATVTQAYDTFGRPLAKTEPLDATNNRYIYTPAPIYDPNDNITSLNAPGFTTAGGAASSTVYDKADQAVEAVTPKDEAADPVRKTTMTYDKVGNILTFTEPMGNVPTPTGDYTTTTRYDAIYQPIEAVDATGGKATASYDNVGKHYDDRRRAQERHRRPGRLHHQVRVRPQPPRPQDDRCDRQVHLGPLRPGRTDRRADRRRRERGTGRLRPARPADRVEGAGQQGRRRHDQLPDDALRVRPGRQPDQGRDPTGRGDGRRGRFRVGHRLRPDEPGQGADLRARRRTTGATRPSTSTTRWATWPR